MTSSSAIGNQLTEGIRGRINSEERHKKKIVNKTITSKNHKSSRRKGNNDKTETEKGGRLVFLPHKGIQVTRNE